MAPTTTETTHARIVVRLTDPDGPYGYTLQEARETATQMLASRTPGQISSFLGDAEGCENCGDTVVKNHRCGRCQHLPSDDL